MSNETLFYICGITLAISAVVTSFIGLKNKDFPGKAMPIVILWFAVFVVGSATFAVLHAKDEDAAKAAEFKEAGKKAESEGADTGSSEEAEEEVEGGEGLPEEGEVGPEEEGGKLEEPGGGGESTEGGEEAESAEGGAEASAGGNPEAGEAVFTENCSICHGSDGHGGNGGPDLRTMPLAKTEAGAIEQVTNGGGGMPPFGGQLSEEEIADVAAYVSNDIVGGS